MPPPNTPVGGVPVQKRKRRRKKKKGTGGAALGAPALVPAVAPAVAPEERDDELAQALAPGAVEDTPAEEEAQAEAEPPVVVQVRDTPKGTLPGRLWTRKGKAYGDTRKKHTKVGDCTLQEILGAIEDPDTAGGELRTFADWVNNGGPGRAAFGSQLSKEAVDDYGGLVRKALKEARYDKMATSITHTADYEVGVNIMTGKPTKTYTLHWSKNYGGWHIFPG